MYNWEGFKVAFAVTGALAYALSAILFGFAFPDFEMNRILTEDNPFQGTTCFISGHLLTKIKLELSCVVDYTNITKYVSKSRNGAPTRLKQITELNVQ